MKYLDKILTKEEIKSLSFSENKYLISILKKFQGFPNLNQMWLLMDKTWIELNCDRKKLNDNVKKFYSHPIWLLNGLFIDQDYQSIKNRELFANSIKKYNPKRILDYSGGFGSLARMISKKFPNTNIDIYEPYPNNLALKKIKNYSNIRYIKKITRKYEFIIATDVFEHVSDPIQQVFNCSKNLKEDGKFLIANCFQDIVLCHLPHLFHLDFCWDLIMKKMGFDLGEKVLYGRIFIKKNKLTINEAKKTSNKAKILFPFVKKIPFARAKIGMLLLALTSKF